MWWSRGGPTDLDNLVGLCSRCHHLVHRDRLIIRADGHGDFIFTDRRSHVMASDLRHRRAVHREALRIHHLDIAIRRRRAERTAS